MVLPFVLWPDDANDYFCLSSICRLWSATFADLCAFVSDTHHSLRPPSRGERPQLSEGGGVPPRDGRGEASALHQVPTVRFSQTIVSLHKENTFFTE